MTQDDATVFRYLTQEQFLALTPEDRIAYLQTVNEHLAARLELLKRQPEKADP